MSILHPSETLEGFDSQIPHRKCQAANGFDWWFPKVLRRVRNPPQYVSTTIRQGSRLLGVLKGWQALG